MYILKYMQNILKIIQKKKEFNFFLLIFWLLYDYLIILYDLVIKMVNINVYKMIWSKFNKSKSNKIRF